jgi:RNA polymerase sigma-70 factor, ECF subfamily
MTDWSTKEDDAVFSEVMRLHRARGAEQAEGAPSGASKGSAKEAEREAAKLLGLLVERWRRPAGYVIRRIQQSYRRGTADDELELFQDAVCKLVERGLDQFRGRGEGDVERPASSKTFFLRIVKHTAIDFYRKHREELAPARPDAEDEPEIPPAEASVAMLRARDEQHRDEAYELYWKAFERLKREHANEAIAWDAYHHQDFDDHDAVARLLGISVANSYKRISRAGAHLRLYLLELRDDLPKP